MKGLRNVDKVANAVPGAALTAREESDGRFEKRALVLAGLAIAYVAGIVFVIARGQDANWDLLHYHYYSGFAFEAGRFSADVGAAGIQTYLHPLPNILTYWALQLPFPVGPILVWTLQFSVVPILLLLANEIRSQSRASTSTLALVLAICLSLSAPVWLSLLGTSFSDAVLSSLILLGLWLAIASLARKSPLFFLSSSGFVLGASVALKLTNIPFFIATAIAVLILPWTNWRAIQTRMSRLLVFSLGATLGFSAFGWWHWHLFEKFGNPFFPFLNEYFLSPYYPVDNFRDDRWQISGIPGFLEYLFATLRGSADYSEIAFADPRFVVVAALLLIGVIVVLRRRSERQVVLAPSVSFLLIFIVVSTGMWAFMLGYQRYLIPVELLLGIVSWSILLVMRIRPSYQVAILGALLLVSLSGIKVPNWGHTPGQWGDRNPFDINLTAMGHSGPAGYVYSTPPVSFLFPSLDPRSTFTQLGGVSTNLDRDVLRVLREQSEPVRVIVREGDGSTAITLAQAVQPSTQPENLSCGVVQTSVGGFWVCELP